MIFINDRIIKDRKDVHGLTPTVRDNIYRYGAHVNSSGFDVVMSDAPDSKDTKIEL